MSSDAFTLTPITLCPPRPMAGTVNGVSYLQEVRIGEHKVIALLDDCARLHSVHGGRFAGLGDGLAFEIVRLARGMGYYPILRGELLARHGYRLEADGE